MKNEDRIIAVNTINSCVAELAESDVGCDELSCIYQIDNLPPEYVRVKDEP